MFEELKWKTGKLREEFDKGREIHFENGFSLAANVTEEPRLVLMKDGREELDFKNFFIIAYFFQN